MKNDEADNEKEKNIKEIVEAYQKEQKNLSANRKVVLEGFTFSISDLQEQWKSKSSDLESALKGGKGSYDRNELKPLQHLWLEAYRDARRGLNLVAIDMANLVFQRYKLDRGFSTTSRWLLTKYTSEIRKVLVKSDIDNKNYILSDGRTREQYENELKKTEELLKQREEKLVKHWDDTTDLTPVLSGALEPIKPGQIEREFWAAVTGEDNPDVGDGPSAPLPPGNS